MDSQLEFYIIISVHLKVFFRSLALAFALFLLIPVSVLCDSKTFFSLSQPNLRSEITSVNNDEVSREAYRVAIDKVANIKAWKWV